MPTTIAARAVSAIAAGMVLAGFAALPAHAGVNPVDVGQAVQDLGAPGGGRLDEIAGSLPGAAPAPPQGGEGSSPPAAASAPAQAPQAPAEASSPPRSGGTSTPRGGSAPSSRTSSPNGLSGDRPTTRARSTSGAARTASAAARTAARDATGARRGRAQVRAPLAPPAPRRSPPGSVARVAQGIVRVVPVWMKVALGALAALALGLGISTFLTRRRLTAAERLAATDMLTGLANHRSVQETLRRMVAQAHRTSTPLAAILFDLDHFKLVNDEHGHGMGDEVLSGVGAAFRRTFRTSDFAGRYGGEEFVMLLPDTDVDGAVVAAEKLREALKAMRVYGIEREITASFGVAVVPDDAREASELLHRADQALYAAKERGRDRVEVAGVEARELVAA